MRYGILVFTLLTQMMFIGSIYLEQIGIPFIRQALGFIYLSFIPGFLLSQVIGVYNLLDTRETILYSVGLSLSFLMLIGFLINSVCVYFGISSIKIIFFSIIFINILLNLALILKKNKKKMNKNNFSLSQISPFALAIILLIPISIFSAFQLLYYNSNSIYLFLVGLISIMLYIVPRFNENTNFLSFSVWVIFLSLIFSVTLSIKYLPWHSGDSAIEYYFANLVKLQGFWNPHIRDPRNAMLSIVFLHPIYSIFLNIDLSYVFRVVYPLLYSLVAPIIYTTLEKQMDKESAFISTSLFIIFPFTYILISKCTREGIAMLFIALFILTAIAEIPNVQKSVLLLVFSLSTVVSHYATSYLFMFSLLIATALYRFLVRTDKYGCFAINFCIMYVVCCISWYLYISSGIAYGSFVRFGEHVVTSLSEFLEPETSYSVYALVKNWTPSIEFAKYIILIVSILISIGILNTIINLITRSGRDNTLRLEYVVYSISFFIILLLTFLPTKEIFSTPRVYPICLIVLAPLYIIGLSQINKFLRLSKKTLTKISITLLVLLLLSGSGFISELVIKGDDYSPNVIVSKPRSNNIKNDPQYLRSYYGIYFNDGEFVSSIWLLHKRDRTEKIYLDSYSEAILVQATGPNWIQETPPLNLYVHVTNKSEISKGYIYLRTYNIKRDVSIHTPPLQLHTLSEVYPLAESSKIYSNEKSEIYYFR